MRIFIISASLLLGLFISLACQDAPDPAPSPAPKPKMPTPPTSDSGAITYLALGDSYTIGEKVDRDKRWPVQLAQKLGEQGFETETTIVAKTGWTTAELQAGIVQSAISDTFELVSLLIGVNNQYRGQPLSQYKTEFAELLETAIGFAGGRRDKVFVLSIPDYGVTPFGANRDPQRIAAEIDAFNQAHRAICEAANVSWFDITPISREADDNPPLVAVDGLHPSGEMYRRWVELIFPDVLEMVRKE